MYANKETRNSSKNHNGSPRSRTSLYFSCCRVYIYYRLEKFDDRDIKFSSKTDITEIDFLCGTRTNNRYRMKYYTVDSITLDRFLLERTENGPKSRVTGPKGQLVFRLLASRASLVLASKADFSVNSDRVFNLDYDIMMQ